MAATHALDRLADLDQFDLFGKPVEGVEGYEEVIKSPMDFSTIRRRLQLGCYPSISTLALDVLLVGTNSMTFNAPGGLHHDQAMYVMLTYDAV